MYGKPRNRDHQQHDDPIDRIDHQFKIQRDFFSNVHPTTLRFVAVLLRVIIRHSGIAAKPGCERTDNEHSNCDHQHDGNPVDDIPLQISAIHRLTPACRAVAAKQRRRALRNLDVRLEPIVDHVNNFVRHGHGVDNPIWHRIICLVVFDVIPIRMIVWQAPI